MRLLGVDVGARRIGLAISDVTATLATPLRTINISGSVVAAAAAVAREVATLEHDPDGLAAVVVGFPTSLDGQPHAQTEVVRAFVAALRTCTDLPIETQDERLTSREAEERLAIREKSWRRRKARLDAAAAAIFLQDYLDQRKHGPRS